MQRILLFGKIGQLGWELLRTLGPLGEIAAFDYPEVDFTHPDQVAALVRESRAAAVINAVAYTAVDRAESELEKARLINATSVGAIAEEAAKLKIPFIHYSTDYVFDGEKGSLYTEWDRTNPINAYGKTKLEGEEAAAEYGGAPVILRTSWVYSERRDSFLTKILKWSRSQPVLRVVDDQVGSPTWSRMLAEVTAQLLAKAGDDPFEWLGERRGVYHLGGEGAASRFEWAEEIIRCGPAPEGQAAVRLERAKSEEFPTPAPRPYHTALDCSKFRKVFGLGLTDWRAALWLAMERASAGG